MNKTVEYGIICMPEETPVKGNVTCISDEIDAEAEKWVIDQLDSGNPWAWCSVMVVATIDGIPLEGEDSLGCCSYKSEADFMNDEYYTDLKNEALRILKSKIETVQRLNGLENDRLLK